MADPNLNPILTTRARLVLKHLVGADAQKASDLIEKLLIRYFTRVFTNDPTGAVSKAEHIEHALMAVPMMAWVTFDGAQCNQASLAYDMGEVLRELRDLTLKVHPEALAQPVPSK